MKCSNCGTEIKGTDLFCSKCGASVSHRAAGKRIRMDSSEQEKMNSTDKRVSSFSYEAHSGKKQGNEMKSSQTDSVSQFEKAGTGIQKEVPLRQDVSQGTADLRKMEFRSTGTSAGMQDMTQVPDGFTVNPEEGSRISGSFPSGQYDYRPSIPNVGPSVSHGTVDTGQRRPRYSENPGGEEGNFGKSASKTAPVADKDDRILIKILGIIDIILGAFMTFCFLVSGSSEYVNGIGYVIIAGVFIVFAILPIAKGVTAIIASNNPEKYVPVLVLSIISVIIYGIALLGWSVSPEKDNSTLAVVAVGLMFNIMLIIVSIFLKKAVDRQKKRDETFEL